jgi:hypothetical protein
VLDISSPDRLNHTASAIIVYGLGVVVLGTLLALALLQVIRNARRARAAEATRVHTKLPTDEGPAVVMGRVRLEDDSEPAVRVAITQRGKQWIVKGQAHHEWREFARDVSYRPFFLLLASGERLRVLPDKHVNLLDLLDSTERVRGVTPEIPVSFLERLTMTDPKQWRVRQRCAELMGGERAYISGVIKMERDPGAPGRGYRDMGTSPVLRRPLRERLVISTTPMEDRFVVLARHYTRIAAALALAFIVVNGVLFYSFHVLNLKGRQVTATTASTRTWTTTHKGRPRTHYEVTARYVDPDRKRHLLVEEVTLSAFFRISEKGAPIPFVIDPSNPQRYMIGTEAHANVFSVICFVVGCIIAAFCYFRFDTLPWYERRLLIERGLGGL